jgi:hypothetical protein
VFGGVLCVCPLTRCLTVEEEGALHLSRSLLIILTDH